MLWVLKRTVSMFFWAPITYVQTDGLENIYSFTLKKFVYLNLCSYENSKSISGGIGAWQGILSSIIMQQLTTTSYNKIS